MKENFPSYFIKKIPGNGSCILRAFKENFEATMNQDISLEDLKENLREKMCLKYYQEFLSSAEIKSEWKDPLKIH